MVKKVTKGKEISDKMKETVLKQLFLLDPKQEEERISWLKKNQRRYCLVGGTKLTGHYHNFSGYASDDLVGNISYNLTGDISRDLSGGDISNLVGHISSEIAGVISVKAYGDITGIGGDMTGIEGSMEIIKKLLEEYEEYEIEEEVI